MTFRSLLVVAAGVIGSVSAAAAQTPPAPPPAPPAGPAAPGPVPVAPVPGASAAAPGAPAPGAPAAPTGAAPTATAVPGVPVAPMAAAQPADPNATVQPPPAAPAMASQPTANAPPPAAAPVLSAQWTPEPQAGADKVATEEEPEKLIWRGTTFSWNQGGTTQIFGIGSDYQGTEEQFYGWDFTLRPNIFLLDREQDNLTAFVEIGWSTELTDGNTVERRETQFRDLQLGARYGRTLWESGGVDEGEYKTSGAFSFRTVLPTSPTSYNQGKYLTLAFGPQISQKIKLLGSKADGLNNITAAFSVTYARLFSKGEIPLNADINRPRLTASGGYDQDQLGRWSFDRDRLTTGLSLSVPLYKDLSLTTAARLISRWKYELGDGGDTCIDLETGCALVGGSSDGAGLTYHANTSFDVSLNYPIWDVVSLTLGYNNDTSQIRDGGERASLFYTPDAQFYLDLTANLDVIFQKATGSGGAKASAARRGDPTEL